jgi:Transglycosylase SLT domain
VSTRPVHHVALALATGAILVGACGGGGGGQLAGGGATTTTSTDRTPIPASDLAIPRSAKATARELTEVEVGLRASDTPTSELRDLGLRQQEAYRALGAHPDWAPTVIAGVPTAVRAAVQANIDAGASLAALGASGGGAPSSFPPWQILTPEPVATLRSYYDEAEAATGIPWAYLAAIHLVETRHGRIRGPSTAGAQGPMQFIPATWASYGEGDINSNHDAIQAAARYLKSRGGPADMDRALFSYNNDDRYVAAVQDYAKVLLADPAAYAGYHEWQVFVATTDGVFLLPEGFVGPGA